MKKIICFILLYLMVFEHCCAAPTIADFAKESDYRDAAISPNGQYLAAVWNRSADNARIVVVHDLHAEGWPIVGKMTERIVRPSYVSWANDKRLLVNVKVPYQTKSVIRDMEKKDDFNIYDYFMFSRTIAIDVDGGNPVVLMNDERRVRRNINLSRIRHFLPNDPDHILMAAFRSERLTLFKVNVFTGESERVAVGTKSTIGFLSDESGNPEFRIDYKRYARQLRIYELEGEDDWELVEKIELEDSDDTQDRGDLVGLHDGEMVYLKKNPDTGYKEIWKFVSKTKEFVPLVTLENRDVFAPLSSVRTNEIIGYAVDGDLIRFKFFDEEYQEYYDSLEKLVGQYNFSVVSSSSDGNKTIVRVSGADNPGSFYLYDVNKKKLEHLANQYSTIAINDLAIPAKLKYRSRDKALIDSYILLPPGFKKGQQYPLVVLPHGGPNARDRLDYDMFSQFISTRGYIVIRPNFRGSIGYGKDFEESGYKQWGGIMQDDLVDAVNFMVKKGYADKNKVCIVGISYGGYAALMGLIKTPELYNCAVSINGVTDLPDMVRYDEKNIGEDDLVEKYIYKRIGHPKDDYENLVKNSPSHQAQKISDPVLIIAGDQDTVVPIKQAKKMVKALKKNKKDYKYLVLEDTWHNPFYYREDIETVFAEVEEFLKENFK